MIIENNITCQTYEYTDYLRQSQAMFNEQKFINDFIDANFNNNQEDENIDFEDVRKQIESYGEEMLYSYTAADYKYIAILYNGNICTADYKTMATEAIYKLYPKILTEYIDHEYSDAGTYYDDYDQGNDDDFNHDYDLI